MACAASAAVVVRSIDDLRADPTVAEAEKKFSTLATASVIYSLCTREFAITPEQQAYHTDALNRSAKEYSDAFYNAYLTKVLAPPPQKIVDYYTQFISTLQQNTLAQAEYFRSTSGCKGGKIEQAYLRAEKMHYDEVEAAKKAKGKKYDPWSAAPATAPAQPAPTPAPTTPAAPAAATPAATAPPPSP